MKRLIALLTGGCLFLSVPVYAAKDKPSYWFVYFTWSGTISHGEGNICLTTKTNNFAVKEAASVIKGEVKPAETDTVNNVVIANFTRIDKPTYDACIKTD